MTHVGYLTAGWGISVGVMVVYGVSVIRRGRSMAKRVPQDRRRWMTTRDAERIGES